MPKTPLSKLPLRSIPFNSRITDEYGTEDKNYFLVGFNPGYALQASELNEIQELFFMNQSLTFRFSKNWINTVGTPVFWEGLVPLNPESVTVTNIIATSTSPEITATINISPDWFLWTNFQSKLSFWIYLNQSLTETVSTSNGGFSSGTLTEYIGLEIETQTINCCPAEDCGDNDSTLRDNSSGTTDNFFTCGASRLKAKINKQIEIRDDIASNFYPILKIETTANSGLYTSSITTLDGSLQYS